jgi:hypothetical protein
MLIDWSLKHNNPHIRPPSWNKLLQPRERLSRINGSRAPPNLFSAWWPQCMFRTHKQPRNWWLKPSGSEITTQLALSPHRPRLRWWSWFPLVCLGHEAKVSCRCCRKRRLGARQMRSDVLFELVTGRLVKDSIGSLATSTKTKMMLMVSISLFGKWSKG